jgi:hypothetical protein
MKAREKEKKLGVARTRSAIFITCQFITAIPQSILCWSAS